MTIPIVAVTWMIEHCEISSVTLMDCYCLKMFEGKMNLIMKQCASHRLR